MAHFNLFRECNFIQKPYISDGKMVHTNEELVGQKWNYYYYYFIFID